MWEKDRNWGYVQHKTSEEATNAYVEMAEKLKMLIPFGYSTGVYTQTTGVEVEVNGLLAYDRKVIKLNETLLRKEYREFIQILEKQDSKRTPVQAWLLRLSSICPMVVRR